MRTTLDPDNGLLRQAQDLASIGAAAVLTRKGLKPLIECESAAAHPACWQRQAGRTENLHRDPGRCLDPDRSIDLVPKG